MADYHFHVQRVKRSAGKSGRRQRVFMDYSNIPELFLKKMKFLHDFLTFPKYLTNMRTGAVFLILPRERGVTGKWPV